MGKSVRVTYASHGDSEQPSEFTARLSNDGFDRYLVLEGREEVLALIKELQTCLLIHAEIETKKEVRNKVLSSMRGRGF